MGVGLRSREFKEFIHSDIVVSWLHFLSTRGEVLFVNPIDSLAQFTIVTSPSDDDLPPPTHIRYSFFTDQTTPPHSCTPDEHTRATHTPTISVHHWLTTEMSRPSQTTPTLLTPHTCIQSKRLYTPTNLRSQLASPHTHSIPTLTHTHACTPPPPRLPSQRRQSMITAA